MQLDIPDEQFLNLNPLKLEILKSLGNINCHIEFKYLIPLANKIYSSYGGLLLEEKTHFCVCDWLSRNYPVNVECKAGDSVECWYRILINYDHKDIATYLEYHV